MGKIIVFGDVNGQLSDAFNKLAKLHAKQSFSFAIIAGNLFADSTTLSDDQQLQLDKLLRGEIEVPVTTYFALGQQTLPQAVAEKLAANEGEACPNLFVLGQKVSIKTSEGFKVVAIGGNCTDEDIESAKEFREADVLLTSEWPAGILDGSKIGFGQAPSSNPALGDLVTVLKPRYHLSASELAYEREPFFHSDGRPPLPVTRFISLAPLNNATKSKAMYAFSLEPSAPPPERLEGVTASPFIQKKRKLESQQDSYNSYRYANGNGNYEHDHRRKKRRRQPDEPRDCFFCLANRNVETHMITSIGEDAYMAIAKGPLSTTKTFSSLGLHNPCHILIVPMEHSATFIGMEKDDDRQRTKAEMQRYRDSLHTLITAKSTNGENGEARLGAVTWEISRGNGVHVHWQFLPMPVELINKDIIEAAFDVEAENSKYGKFAKTESEIAAAEEGDYFKAMIWSESKEREIVLPLEKDMKFFDLQFARRVLGKLLNLTGRTHWKDCPQTTAEETADADGFKEIFRAYDFSLIEEKYQT